MSNTYTLNQIGQAGVLAAVRKYATQLVIDNLAKGQYDWFNYAEQGAVDGQDFMFEIGSYFSKTGNPVTVNCPASWFDATPIEA